MSSEPQGADTTAMETRLESIEMRLARAERQVRVLRGVVLTIFVGAIAVLTVKPGVTQDEGSTAKAPFRVVDDGEKPLLQVDTCNNATCLRLCDQSGKPRLTLVATDEGGDLLVSDKAGNLAAALDGAKDSGHLGLYKGEKPLASLGALEGGEPGFIIYNKAGGHVASLISSQWGGALHLENKDGKRIAGISALEDGGGFAVFDKTGEAAATVLATPGGGCLCLQDKTGTTTFSKP